MAQRSTKICDSVDGKRAFFLLPEGDRLKVGRGKPFSPSQLLTNVSKGDARRIRKALRAAGRHRLIRLSIPEPTPPTPKEETTW